MGEIVQLSLVTYAITIANNVVLMNTMVCAAPIASSASAVLSVFTCYVSILLMTSLTLILATKYFSLFHGPMISGIDDNDLLKIFKIVILFVPTLVTIIEFEYITEISHLATYQVLSQGKANAYNTMETGLVVFYGLNFLLAICMQFRLEAVFNEGIFAKMKRWFRHSQTQPNFSSIVGYKPSIIRILFAMGILSVLVMVYQVSIDFMSGQCLAVGNTATDKL